MVIIAQLNDVQAKLMTTAHVSLGQVASTLYTNGHGIHHNSSWGHFIIGAWAQKFAACQ